MFLKSKFFQFIILFSLLFNAVTCSNIGGHMPLEKKIPKVTDPNNKKEPPPSESCELRIEKEFGYEEDIIPIINNKCKNCHGESSQTNWLDYALFASKKDRVFYKVFEAKDMPLVGAPPSLRRSPIYLEHGLKLVFQDRDWKLIDLNVPTNSSTNLIFKKLIRLQD